MASLHPPSTLDDPLDDDPLVDPLDLTRWRAARRRWPGGLDGLVDRGRGLGLSPGQVIALAGAVVLVGVGAWWLLRPAPPPVEASLPMASSADVSPPGPGVTTVGSGPITSTTAATELVVQASGAIVRPGVYRLPSTARVDDLVRSAGGFRPDADGDRVNLAAPLLDGVRVWVPAQGEAEPPEVVAASGGTPPEGSPGSGPAAGTGPTPQPVDLNAATAEQLDTLPGVGPSTASAILAYRQEHGPFSSVDDLLEVRGIGEAKLEQIRPLARV